VNRGRDTAAVVLAIGIALAVNAVTLGVLWDAIRSEGPGLSSNATQVLTTAFGGIIGVLGSYLGFRAGEAAAAASSTAPPEPPPASEAPAAPADEPPSGVSAP
jgi:hypothetical protein